MRYSVLIIFAAMYVSPALSASRPAPSAVLYEVAVKQGRSFRSIYPRLIDAPPAIRARVNRRIAVRFNIIANGCGNPKMDYEASVSSVLVIHHLVMSVYGTEDYDCHGAYPSTDSIGLTFDLATGKQVTLASQFKSGSEGGLSQILVDRYKTEHPENRDGEQDCTSDFYDGNAPVVRGFAFDRDSLILWNQNNHASAACDVTAKVPLYTVRELLAPKSLALRILDRRK